MQPYQQQQQQPHSAQLPPSRGWNEVVETQGSSFRSQPQQQPQQSIQMSRNGSAAPLGQQQQQQPYSQQPSFTNQPRASSPGSLVQSQRPSDIFFGPPRAASSVQQQQQPSRQPSLYERTLYEVNTESQTPTSTRRVPSQVTWNVQSGGDTNPSSSGIQHNSPRPRPLSPLTITNNMASAMGSSIGFHEQQQQQQQADDFVRMQSPHRHSGGSFGSGLTLSSASSMRVTHPTTSHPTSPDHSHPQQPQAGPSPPEMTTHFPRSGSYNNGAVAGRHSRTPSGEPALAFPTFQPIDTEFDDVQQQQLPGQVPQDARLHSSATHHSRHNSGQQQHVVNHFAERSHSGERSASGGGRYVDPTVAQQQPQQQVRATSADQASPQRSQRQQPQQQQQQQLFESPNRPTMQVLHPRASSAAFSRNHWTSIRPVASAPPFGNDASDVNNTTGMTIDVSSIQLQQEQAQAQYKKAIREKNEEIMKLRASLIVALQCYAYTPAGGRPVSAAERRFLSAVTSAVEHDGDAPPQLIVDQPPAHVQGIPCLPLPLEINSIMGQFSGYLQMLETEEKTIFKKAWKPRYVVADQHGITVFRDEADFKLHAFHKAVMTIPYHDLEYFVPSFHDASIPEMLERAKAGNDASVAALTQMHLISQQYAGADQRNAYFGFIAKQTPNSQTKNTNPQIVFRSRSSQEHSDWAHFLAKCFNIRLYRDLFPMMLAETMFGLLSKDCQTNSTEFGITIETQTEDVHVTALEDPNMMSPPPPPPPADGMPGEGAFLTAAGGDDLFGEMLEGTTIVDDTPKFAEAGTETDAISWRVSASQTDDLAQWISSAPTDSNEIHTDESAALQRHIHALEEQCKLLRSEWDEVKIERDEAADHAAAVQQSLQVAERETKRLRQLVLDEHSNALNVISEAQKEELDTFKEKQTRLVEIEFVNAQLNENVAELANEVESLKSQLAHSNKETEELKVELAISQDAFAEQLKALADKAVADMDMLHHEMLHTRVPDSTASPAHHYLPPPPLFSPPRGMLLEGMSAEMSPQEHVDNGNAEQRHIPAGSHRIGSLEVLSNHVGDVQFNVHLDDRVCHISATHELRDQLRKVWKIKSELIEGEIELSARLRWDDDNDDAASDDGSSVGLPEEWHEEEERGDHPSVVRHQHTTTMNLSSVVAHQPSSAMKSIIGESSQGLLERLQRATPAAALAGRVALQSQRKPPFVPYV